MRSEYSAQLHRDVQTLVVAAQKSAGVVNLAAVAEGVRLGNLGENIAREDIERLVMQMAQLFGAPVEFDNFVLVEAGADAASVFGK